MKILSEANETLLKILAVHKRKSEQNRLMHFCTEVRVEDGVLLFNLLTKELILLDDEEYTNLLELEYLKERWFVVPEDTKEKEYADMIRWMLSVKQKKTEEITNYTIFTTTDCNARCFYCFELGNARIPMSMETAKKVAEYIKGHCGNKKVRITWFGGEPLLNYEVIDLISEELRESSIEYTAIMISNAYLFDDVLVKKAVDSWNLKCVQITLDGTEAVYNKIKAYIHKEGSPYERVLSNIERLLDASIKVSIRLNMDMHNADDLLRLVDELASRFEGKKKLMVYAHHLYKNNTPSAHIHSEDDWNKRCMAMALLNEKIARYGLASKKGLDKQYKLDHCMADSDSAITILPRGDIGVCENHCEDEFIGHIDREGFDANTVRSWKETVPRIAECDACFYYPDCIMLKKCSHSSVCFHQHRQELYVAMQHSMLNEYKKWQSQNEN